MSSENPTQSKPLEVEVDIFSIAFNERKRANLQKLDVFFKQRHQSLFERRRIYLILQERLFQKIQASKETIKEYIRYYEDIISWYEVIFKHMKKFELQKKAKEVCEYKEFSQILGSLEKLNAEEKTEIQTLVHMIEKTVLPSLNASLDGFKALTKTLRKQVQSLFNNADSARFAEEKFYSKIQENNDLLENEMYLIDKIQHTDRCTVEWGNKLLENWKKLLKQEEEVKDLLKTNVLEYNRKHCRLYHTSEINQNISEFWGKLEKTPQIKAIFCSFLEEKDIDFISFGFKKQESFYMKFQRFIKLESENERVGEILPLIQILQSKYFKCKIQKDKKEWVPTKAYFSLDEHMLLFDEEHKKLVLKVNTQGLKATKKTENMAEVVGKEEGFIFDSTRKQTLHFTTMDECDEFIFYLENIMGENKPQGQEAK